MCLDLGCDSVAVEMIGLVMWPSVLQLSAGPGSRVLHLIHQSVEVGIVRQTHSPVDNL